jgi:hypothetical protein
VELRRIENCVAVLLVQQGNIDLYILRKIKENGEKDRLLIKGTILVEVAVQRRKSSNDDGE